MKIWKNMCLCFFKWRKLSVLLLRATGPCPYRRGTWWGQRPTVWALTPRGWNTCLHPSQEWASDLTLGVSEANGAGESPAFGPLSCLAMVPMPWDPELWILLGAQDRLLAHSWRSWCYSCCFCSSRVWNSLETQTVDSKLMLLFWQRPKPPRCFLLTIGSGRTQCFVRLSSEFQLQQLTRVCLTHLSVSIEMILSSCKVAFLSRIMTQAVKKRTVCSLPQLTCVNYSGNFMCNYSVHLIMLFAWSQIYSQLSVAQSGNLPCRSRRKK